MKSRGQVGEQNSKYPYLGEKKFEKHVFTNTPGFSEGLTLSTPTTFLSYDNAVTTADVKGASIGRFATGGPAKKKHTCRARVTNRWFRRTYCYKIPARRGTAASSDGRTNNDYRPLTAAHGDDY